MEKKIVYLYPEVEGKQYFVCWGIQKGNLGRNAKEEIKSLVLGGLKEIKGHENRWVSQRSFSVLLGEDAKNLWVAVPRELTAKAMKLLGHKLSAYSPKIVITSFENPFGKELPFRPVISYDRGFIFDSTSIEEKLLNADQEEMIVNI